MRTVAAMTAADRLLSRLEGVRQTGPGRWIAKCPAHDDRSPSLSIRELADGQLLLHDFAGCAAADVVQAAGLSLADLFPDGGSSHHHGRRKPPRIPAGDLLMLAAREVLVASIITADLLDRHNITEAEWQRLAQSSARLGRLADEVRS